MLIYVLSLCKHIVLVINLQNFECCTNFLNFVLELKDLCLTWVKWQTHIHTHLLNEWKSWTISDLSAHFTQAHAPLLHSVRQEPAYSCNRTNGRKRPPLSSAFCLIIESIGCSGRCMSQVLRSCCMQTANHTYRTPCKNTIHVSREVWRTVFLLLSLFLNDIAQLRSGL